MAAATLSANSQLVAALTATVVEPEHNVAPLGGNVSDGVADGVTVALCTLDEVPLALLPEADVLADGDFDVAPASAVGEPPPVNQSTPPMIAAMTSRASRMMTPRAPDKFPCAGRDVGGSGVYGRSDGKRSASGVPGRYDQDGDGAGGGGTGRTAVWSGSVAPGSPNRAELEFAGFSASGLRYKSSGIAGTPTSHVGCGAIGLDSTDMSAPHDGQNSAPSGGSVPQRAHGVMGAECSGRIESSWADPATTLPLTSCRRRLHRRRRRNRHRHRRS